MPRVCTVCRHPERAAIDEAIVARPDSIRDIAGQFKLSKSAIDRHRRHLPAHLAQAAEAKEVASADSLLEQMRALQEKTLAILDAAKDPRTALSAVREARGNLELLAEMIGTLAHQPTLNVLISTEWVTVRSAVLDALLSERPGIGPAFLFPAPKDPSKPVDRWFLGKRLRRAERLAEVPKQAGSLFHAYRRKWGTERKHLPIQDVAQAGGWKNTACLATIYQQPDDATLYAVVSQPAELREAKA